MGLSLGLTLQLVDLRAKLYVLLLLSINIKTTYEFNNKFSINIQKNASFLWLNILKEHQTMNYGLKE